MKHKVLYIALAVLALAVAVPLATTVLAQTPTPTPTPTPSAAPQAPTHVPPRFHARGHMGRGPQGVGAGLGVLRDFQTIKRASTLLKLTPQDLYTKAQAGQTLAQIAQAQGVSVSDLASTILAPFKDELQIQVKYGNISQEQADFTLFVRTQNLVKLLDKPLPLSAQGTPRQQAPSGMMGPGGPGPGGMGGGMMTPQGAGPNGITGGGMMGGNNGGGMMGGGMMGGYGQTW